MIITRKNIISILAVSIITLQAITNINYHILKNPTTAEKNRVKTEIIILLRQQVEHNQISEESLNKGVKLAIKCQQEVTEALEELKLAERNGYMVTDKEIVDGFVSEERIKRYKEHKYSILNHVTSSPS